MAFTEDLSEFFDTTYGFAITMRIDIATGPSNGNQVDGIFDDEYVDEAGELGIELTAPTFLCAKSDVANIKHGDRLTNEEIDGQFTAVGQKYFKVRGVMPDGTGLVRLALEEQNETPVLDGNDDFVLDGAGAFTVS